MDPNNQPPVYTGNSLEYLNQISPNKPAPKSFLNKKVIAIIGGVVVLLIILVAVAASSNQTPAVPSGQILGYRLTGLNELITFGENNTINNSGLKKALSETKLVSLSEQYQISTYITLPATDSKTPVPTDEAVTQTVDTLSKAVSSGNFNRNYADALIAQIQKIQTALLEIRAESTNQAVTNRINANLTSYNAIIERLTNY